MDSVLTSPDFQFNNTFELRAFYLEFGVKVTSLGSQLGSVA